MVSRNGRTGCVASTGFDGGSDDVAAYPGPPPASRRGPVISGWNRRTNSACQARLLARSKSPCSEEEYMTNGVRTANLPLSQIVSELVGNHHGRTVRIFAEEIATLMGPLSASVW